MKADGWVEAWHGCKLEGLYSILYHGCLRESQDRMLRGVPGVYVHKKGTKHKADNYSRFFPLCDDGVFWSAKWELMVNAAERQFVPGYTDQWVLRASGVRLCRLWLCGRTTFDMRNCSPVSLKWDPELEANPLNHTWSSPTHCVTSAARKRQQRAETTQSPIAKTVKISSVPKRRLDCADSSVEDDNDGIKLPRGPPQRVPKFRSGDYDDGPGPPHGPLPRSQIEALQKIRSSNDNDGPRPSRGPPPTNRIQSMHLRSASSTNPRFKQPACTKKRLLFVFK